MQMIAEIYGLLRDGLGMSAARDRPCLRGLESRPAQLLPDRDHRQGPRRARPRLRQARGRPHPRPCRPEGHRQMVGHRGADAGRSGHRHRGGGRRPRAVGHERRARGRRPRLWRSARWGSCRGSRCDARRSGAGAVCRQDRRLCPGLRGDGRRLQGVRLAAAAADDRQDLARRLHHPLAVSGHAGRGLRGRRRARATC